jgi:hypothetical protein
MNGFSGEDPLETPHQDMFSGVHSMPTRSRPTATLPMSGMMQYAGNRISGIGAEYV